MYTIKKENKLCLSCMEEHGVSIVKVNETNLFKNEKIEYEATYYYCENSDEYYATEEMISANDIAMKNAYRIKSGLLTTNEIINIREKYGITQSDLAIILGWGKKTITRYEGHQVQESAYDSILRKINEDPEWFLTLLTKNKEKISENSFKKYLQTAKEYYANAKNEYAKKIIFSQYVKYNNGFDFGGNRQLDLDKVVDATNYFASSQKVTSLYTVKLMKLLWYSDALSFKRHNKSITGLVYKALPMGAVPIGYENIKDLEGIEYETEEFMDNVGYRFISSNKENKYQSLSKEEKAILDKVINQFGNKSKSILVNAIHKETAYLETAQNDIIQYKYTKDLSLK